MAKYYSKTTKGFYDTTIYRLSTDASAANAALPAMPADAVAVTDAAYSALFAAQSVGQVIQSDANGNPISAAPPPPSPAQIAAGQAQAALAAGVILTSTGNSALDATYPIADSTKTNLTGLIVYIGLKGTFPGGAMSTNIYDTAGTAHAFNVTQFEAFAEDVCTFIDAVEEWQLGGGTGDLPSNQITIA